MKSRLLWFFMHLLCFLTGSLVDSSALPSGAHPLSIMSTVGSQAVLPCSWKSHQREATPSTCHIQWVSPPYTLFEQRGEEKWEAEEFEGRLELPPQTLGSGDCSLIIKNVQIEDTGVYESFMVVDGARSTKSRVFIQSVRLSVTDNKSKHVRHPGEDFVLELFTPRAFTVAFQGRNSSEWLDLWRRGESKNSARLEKHPLLEQLTIKKLRRSDEGTYKVLDENGLAVSTLQLSVEENSPTFRAHQTELNTPTGSAAKSSCSALLIFSVFVSSFKILHLY